MTNYKTLKEFQERFEKTYENPAITEHIKKFEGPKKTLIKKL